MAWKLMSSVGVLLFVGGLGLVEATAAQAAQDEAGAESDDRGALPEETNTAYALEPQYRRPEDAQQLFSAWLGSGLAERVEVGESQGGRELFAIQFGAAGSISLSERSTVLLLGGLDGVSIAGSEAVLRVTESLLAQPDRLPPDVTFVAIPWANPDGLVRWLDSGCGNGLNDKAVDDDGDGNVDEDGPDDMDDDGVILELLIEDSEGPWARTSDGRFLRPAEPGEAPRYLRMREGRDDDGDGLFNEDQPGGVALDHNFPVGWRGPWEGVDSGDWPLSEQATRALAEFALERRVAAALVFQGNHGCFAVPGGSPDDPADTASPPLPFEYDLTTYKDLTSLFEAATGRSQGDVKRLHEARGRSWPGSAVDWLYTARGAIAAEIGVWGPAVQSSRPPTTGAREGDASQSSPEEASLRPKRDQAEDTTAADRAWAQWLDDIRGGIGFVDWQPVDLGDGREGLVGGWEPLTCYNPPMEFLEKATRGMDTFVLELAAKLPRLEIELSDVSRNGRAYLVRARVRNLGQLPSGVGPTCGELGVHLSVELPSGVTLFAGERTIDLGYIPGEGSSGELQWLFLASEGTVLRLRLESAWTAPVLREVRL